MKVEAFILYRARTNVSHDVEIKRWVRLAEAPIRFPIWYRINNELRLRGITSTSPFLVNNLFRPLAEASSHRSLLLDRSLKALNV